MTRVFWCERTGFQRRWLRRYAPAEAKCPAKPDGSTYHQAMVLVGDTTEIMNAEGYVRPSDPAEFAGDERWPTQCACGYYFTAEDERQVFTRSLYRRMDQSAAPLLPISEMPPGAMWNAWWLASFGHWRGADGISLMVRCPDGHDWCVDGQASNCTMPDDEVHKCWVRHGDPRKGEIHVDKNGVTCKAGAGSIQTGKWHGFLHNSVLRPA